MNQQIPPSTMGQNAHTPAVTGMSLVSKFFKENTGVLPSLLPDEPGVTKQSQVARFLTGLWQCFNETKDLAFCTFESLRDSTMRCASLGLIPGNTYGHCHLIPRMNKEIQMKEANFEMGYHGHVHLMYQHPLVARVDAGTVHMKDDFQYVTGSDVTVKHSPFLDGPRGEHRGAWAVVELTNGLKIVDYMSVLEIQQAVGDCFNNSPAWRSSKGEMMKKTVLKRISKRCPTSNTAREAVSVDDRIEAGIAVPAIQLENLQNKQLEHEEEGNQGGQVPPEHRTDGRTPGPTGQ